MDKEKLIFIGGSMRSGTTILHKILCAANEAHPYITESWFLVDQLRAYLWSLERYDVRHRDYFGDQENFDRFTRDILDRFIKQTRQHLSDPKALVLKNPEITGQFPLLGSWFEDARFIINLRDPRDTIASIIRVGEKHKKNRMRTEQSSMGRDMKALSNFYKRYYIRAFDVNSPIRERTIFVRYEDIMTDVETECARIGEFCGLTFSHQKLRALGEDKTGSANMDADVRSQDPYSGAFWSDLYNKNLSSERIGRYAEVLTPAEIEQVETHCADFNQIFKYW